ARSAAPIVIEPAQAECMSGDNIRKQFFSKQKDLKARCLRSNLPDMNAISRPVAHFPLNFVTFRRMVVNAIMLLALCGNGFAGEIPAPKKIVTVEGITEYQFDNGLRVLLFPDDSQSKFTVNMTVLVGSRQEGYGETGMAHLLEHLVFKGTPNH